MKAESRTTSRRDPYSDNDVLNAISANACERIGEFVEKLGLDLSRHGRRMVGPCPIHGGGNPNAFRLYTDGYEVKGFWECCTKKCHRHFPRSFIGFIRGVLSHQVLGWEREGDRKFKHPETVDFICDVLGCKAGAVEIDHELASRNRFARQSGLLTPEKRARARALCSKRDFLRVLRIPSEYYLGRGYKPETLAEFEAGDCTHPRSDNFGKAVYPVYDADGQHIIGAIARSRVPGVAKHLRHTVVGQFKDKHHVYNLWRARKDIYQSRCIVVAEGAGDVWRLHEAGVRVAVGLFGSTLTPIQAQILEECLISNIIVATDGDEAGDACHEQIAEHFDGLANVHRLRPADGVDVGDMSAAEIRRDFVPFIHSKMRRK